MRAHNTRGVNHPQPYHHFLDRCHPKGYRSGEINTLAAAIRARENRLVLGLPGMGVSNLLRCLVTRVDLFKQNITFVYLDCDSLGDYPGLEALLEAFFEEIVRQLGEQRLGAQMEKGTRGYERLKRVVTRARCDARNRIVIVADAVDQVLAAVNRTFYRNLKALSNLNKCVCYIFAAHPLAVRVVDPENLLFAGRRLLVGRLSERDCAGAITEEAQRLGTKFGSAARERLASLSGGHPGLLRAVSSAVVEEGSSLADPEMGLVERLFARKDVQYRCQKVWNALDSAQQMALQHLAGNRPDLVAAKTLAWLEDLGLVDNEAGERQCSSPIFARFAAGQHISLDPATQETPPEPVKIDHASAVYRDGREIIVTGTVLKGDKEVHVSPHELRLIACLKHERRIYTKDEIAAYVYYEEEGGAVQDTRIENLVRQVRKRLGDGRYIKTHWGQGYEFLG